MASTLPAVRPKSSLSSLDAEGKVKTLDSALPGTSVTSMGVVPRHRRHESREKKIGHRRVDQQTGEVTYKKKPTSELMAAMQLGIGQSITSLSTKPKRDLLLQDFTIVETVFFPREGSNLTPAHHYSDFRFKTYAPIAFRYFRELFGIQPDDFLLSLCNEPLNELSNPGASGSIFYITDDDEFIVKTVQHNEAEFLQKLLPGYYMNLNQNPRTLLPKFYGLYTYQCGGKNIRFTVMNNLLPSTIKLHEKYDLKGSTYKRKASKHERSKKSPTLKDLDFVNNHPEGIFLEADTYNALIKTIERDCRVLQSFKIMDYSLLMAVHNLDKSASEKAAQEGVGAGTSSPVNELTSPVAQSDLNRSISRGKSMKQRLAQYSTAMEAIQAPAEDLEIDNEDIPPGGIPARNSHGERLLIYLGLIDILQCYRLRKKLEHAMKAMVHDADTISVHRPGFYAQRFQSFFADKVFKKIPSSMKHSPSKKRPSQMTRNRAVTLSEVEGNTQTSLYTETAIMHGRTSSDAGSEPAGATGGRPDLLPDTTPPPTFSEATGRRPLEMPATHSEWSGQISSNKDRKYVQRGSDTNPNYAIKPEVITTSPSFNAGDTPESTDRGNQDNSMTTPTSPLHHHPPNNSASSPRSSPRHTPRSPLPSLHLKSPSHSVSEGTPTFTDFTEGTPSYTASSPSCSSDVLDSQSVPSTTISARKEYSEDVTVNHEEIQFQLSPDDEHKFNQSMKNSSVESSNTKEGIPLQTNASSDQQQNQNSEEELEVTHL